MSEVLKEMNIEPVIDRELTEDEASEVVDAITALAQLLGWNAAAFPLLPGESEDDEALGLVLGTPEYVTQVTNAFDIAGHQLSMIDRYGRKGS